MINLPESYVAELGFKLANPASVGRRATDCAMTMKLGLEHICFEFLENKL